MATFSTNRVLVSFKIPAAVAMLIALARAIVLAMQNAKTTFPTPTPTPTLAQVGADIDALVTAETATKARTMGMVPVRDDKRKTLIGDLHQLTAYVQQLANVLGPEQAVALIESAGMTVRKTGSRSKSDLAARFFGAGAVKLVAKAIAGSRSYEWAFSTDGKTWTAAPPSAQAKTVVVGLQTGVLHSFRCRPVLKTGPGEWSQAISMLVA